MSESIQLDLRPFPTPDPIEMAKLSRVRHDYAVLTRWNRLVKANIRRRIIRSVNILPLRPF